MSAAPKVSIVIPVFNGENFLGEAIDSALAQTYPNVEVVVVNDGSRDNGVTERIALSYGDKIRYFSQENGGVAAALNMAIDNMSGQYLSWLSHDDLYFPEKVAAQMEVMQKLDASDVILYSDFGVFYDDPGSLRMHRLSVVQPENFRYSITIGSSVNGCTLLIPKKAFDDCGVFDVALRYTQDYDLWFRFAAKYRFIHVPQVLVKSRSHPGQDSLKLKDNAMREVDRLVLGFAKALSQEELRRNTGCSPAVAYALIATKSRLRGIHEAENVVAGMAWAAALDGSAQDRMTVKWLLWCSHWLVPVYKKLRRVLTIVRAGIRKWFKI
jgi:glycosyltransferase involved in cell wall biosynthesis